MRQIEVGVNLTFGVMPGLAGNGHGRPMKISIYSVSQKPEFQTAERFDTYGYMIMMVQYKSL